MTSCMSSKRSNQLSYASEQWIVYHASPKKASPFLNFFIFIPQRRFFVFRKGVESAAGIDFIGKKRYTETYPAFLRSRSENNSEVRENEEKLSFI